jgi:hypothetical protein
LCHQNKGGTILKNHNRFSKIFIVGKRRRSSSLKIKIKNEYSDIGSIYNKLTAILLSETVKGVIRLGFLADEATESIGGEGVGETTFSIDITDVDLDRGVVLGSDETVGGRAKKKSSRIRRQIHKTQHVCIFIYTSI